MPGFWQARRGNISSEYLPGPYWDMYKATFSDGSYENMRDAVFAACRLFRKLACEMAQELSYTYPLQDDANMTQYLKHVRLLPADAKAILPGLFFAGDPVFVAIQLFVGIVQGFGYKRRVFRFSAFVFDSRSLGDAALVNAVELGAVSEFFRLGRGAGIRCGKHHASEQNDAHTP